MLNPETNRPAARSARPFLKWAGGKSQILDELLARIPARFGPYHEPFLGGGAFFFALRPPAATLTDINIELINCYLVVRDRVEALIETLRQHRNEARHFYSIRKLDPRTLDEIARAARVIYLNKTCYNGLFRENSEGVFNVPFGRYKNPAICDAENLRAAAGALAGQTLRVASFEVVAENAGPGDFVYLDPPYQPRSTTSSFTAYSKEGFGFADQERLARVFVKLTARGCAVMLSNSDVPSIRNLYKGHRVERVLATRTINSKAGGRGAIRELIIRNY